MDNDEDNDMFDALTDPLARLGAMESAVQEIANCVENMAQLSSMDGQQLKHLSNIIVVMNNNMSLMLNRIEQLENKK